MTDLVLRPTDLFQSYYQKALRYLNRRAYSSLELQKKLSKTYPDITAQILEQIILRLQEVQLINDHLLSQQRTKNLQRKGLSQKMISYRLTQQGLAFTAEESLDGQVALEQSDEAVVEFFLLQKKSALLQSWLAAASSSREERHLKQKTLNKLISATISRGHRYETVKKVLTRLAGESLEHDLANLE
jgi:SOS response regulatory protein OraA/RecX